MSTKPALFVLSFLLLAGCDKIADKASDQLLDETKIRNGFVSGCADNANRSSKGAITLETSTKLCNCAYDEAAATYSDRNQWKQDLVRYSIKHDDKAFENKLKTAINSCVDHFSKGQP